MGMNLDYSKQTFETLVGQMDTPLKIQFVVWLDEKLAEYKVQGFMNFNTVAIPRWLKTYSKYMLRSKSTVASEPIQPSISSQPLSGSPRPQKQASQNLNVPTAVSALSDLPTDTQSQQQDDESESSLIKSAVTNDPISVKMEPKETEEDEDVVVVLPEDAPDTSYQQTERLYRGNYTIHRPIKSLRPSHRFAPKNSYAAAVAAHKRRHNRPFSRPSETIVHPSQQQPQVHLPSHLNQNPSESIYAAGSYDDGSGFVENDPSVLSNQNVYTSESEYIQFPVRPLDRSAIKSEYFETAENVSFDAGNFEESSLNFDQSGLETSYDGSFNEGEAEAGMSGMQESWPYPLLGNLLTCRFCSRTFTQHGNLKRHERLHTGSRPYKCPLCDESFPRSDRAKNHLFRCHPPTEKTVNRYRDDGSDSELVDIYQSIYITDVNHDIINHPENIDKQSIFSPQKPFE